MKDLLSKLCAGITPYLAGEQPQDRKYIKLNTNENPYPPSPKVKEALETLDIDRLKLYPDPENAILTDAIARTFGKSKAEIFVGNGSDEVLAMCFPAFFDRDGAGVLFPDVTYSFYPVYSALFGIPYRTAALKEDFTVDIDDYKGIQEQGLIIANPNAPTGIALSERAIEEIVASNRDKVVIVDEAYADFSGVSAVGMTDKYDNLLVVRTFSKSYSLAGIRCGYAIGSPSLIDGLRRIRDSINSYTVDSVTERVAAQALLDAEYHDECVRKVVATRERLSESLRELGCDVLNSSANFLFVRAEKVGGAEVYGKLRKKGILVRHFDKPRIGDRVRITVGSDAEADALLAAFREISDK